MQEGDALSLKDTLPPHYRKFAHYRIFQDKTPEEAQQIVNIANTFVEVYRGIYPFMELSARDQLVELVLKSPNDPGSNARTKTTMIVNLSHQIVTHNMNCMRTGGITLPAPENFAREDAFHLEKFRSALASSLRPDPKKPNSRQEQQILTKQLGSIPQIQDLLANPNPFELFEKWVQQNAPNPKGRPGR